MYFSASTAPPPPHRPGRTAGAVLALGVLDALSLPLVLAPIAGGPPRQVLVATVRETAVPEGVQYIVGIVGTTSRPSVHR